MRLLNITLHFLYSSKIFLHTQVPRHFWIVLNMLVNTSGKAHAGAKSSTWFTRLSVRLCTLCLHNFEHKSIRDKLQGAHAHFTAKNMFASVYGNQVWVTDSLSSYIHKPSVGTDRLSSYIHKPSVGTDHLSSYINKPSVGTDRLSFYICKPSVGKSYPPI